MRETHFTKLINVLAELGIEHRFIINDQYTVLYIKDHFSEEVELFFDTEKENFIK